MPVSVAFKITLGLHLPADILKAPLMKMEEAWGEASLGKQSINSMIGLYMAGAVGKHVAIDSVFCALDIIVLI